MTGGVTDATRPECIICGHRMLRDGACMCGDASVRFGLLMNMRIRYLSDEAERLKVAARRYFEGDKTPEASKELKIALRLWLDCMEDL